MPNPSESGLFERTESAGVETVAGVPDPLAPTIADVAGGAGKLPYSSPGPVAERTEIRRADERCVPVVIASTHEGEVDDPVAESVAQREPLGVGDAAITPSAVREPEDSDSVRLPRQQDASGLTWAERAGRGLHSPSAVPAELSPAASPAMVTSAAAPAARTVAEAGPPGLRQPTAEFASAQTQASESGSPRGDDDATLAALARIERVLGEIRTAVDLGRRESSFQEFSIAKFIGPLAQIVVLAIVAYALFDMVFARELNYALVLVKLGFACVIQLVAVTAFLASSK